MSSIFVRLKYMDEPVKKKVGRPRKIKEHSRMHTVSIRLTEAELKQVNETVRRCGIKDKSELLRKCLLFCAQHDIRLT